MNNYARTFNKKDPLMKNIIGWKRKKDRNLVIFALSGCLLTYVAVYLNEERERHRKHKSIEKDIERERWRAQELGLRAPADDGFADTYITATTEKKGAVDWMLGVINEKLERPQEPEPRARRTDDTRASGGPSTSTGKIN
ncbi:hypothetical protein STCU_01614 [Strigomonas culicis]|uniref:Uncharacterized protein n=1 Tax=Strigomonas culicis TaxID=28005 RepID=S9V027_9TRYP|nr:hypothetical protein STCU_01614 [Strigomonas culicis]|eukprot:EPY34379.1 hypothetical protein STCU_01614 [Strigomonas culicis]